MTIVFSIRYFCFCLLTRATLDLNLRHVNLEKKNLHDSHSRKLREKDRELRNLKKAELQFKVAEDNLTHTQQVHDKVKGNVSNNIIVVYTHQTCLEEPPCGFNKSSS